MLHHLQILFMFHILASFSQNVTYVNKFFLLFHHPLPVLVFPICPRHVMSFPISSCFIILRHVGAACHYLLHLSSRFTIFFPSHLIFAFFVIVIIFITFNSFRQFASSVAPAFPIISQHMPLLFESCFISLHHVSLDFLSFHLFIPGVVITIIHACPMFVLFLIFSGAHGFPKGTTRFNMLFILFSF